MQDLEGRLPQPFQEIAGLALGDQRRGGQGSRVDEAHDAPGLVAEVERSAKVMDRPRAFAFQFDQGQGPGAVQELDAGQVDREAGGAQLLAAATWSSAVQGAEVIQGQPAGEGQGDLLAGFAGNADGVLGC